MNRPWSLVAKASKRAGSIVEPSKASLASDAPTAGPDSLFGEKELEKELDRNIERGKGGREGGRKRIESIKESRHHG